MIGRSVQEDLVYSSLALRERLNEINELYAYFLHHLGTAESLGQSCIHSPAYRTRCSTTPRMGPLTCTPGMHLRKHAEIEAPAARGCLADPSEHTNSISGDRGDRGFIPHTD